MGRLYDELKNQIVKGLQDENQCIPFPLERLSYFINIAKNTMYVLGGESGSGKSSFTGEVFIIQTLLWYLKNKDTTKIKLDVIYFGMERKQFRSSAKWLSRLIFADRGVLLPVNKILGIGDKLTIQEQKLLGEYKPIFEELEPYLTCYEGVIKPSKIEEYLHSFALKNGELKKIIDNEGIIERDVYIPHHPNHIVLVITDHIGLIATTNKKMEIDNFSRIMREARDIYGFSPVIVQQLNRAISDTSRLKMGDISPKLSDFQDTSGTIQDSDVVIALFDPFRHIKEGGDSLGYELSWLRDDKGVKYYRSAHILKNSFNSDGISVPMGYYPFCSMFKTLPRPIDFTEEIADKVKSGKYFQELDQLPRK